MAATPTTFYRGATNGTIGTLATLYDTTTPNMIVTNIIISNTTSSAQKVSITLPDSSGADIPVLSQTVVNANDTVSFDMKQPVAIVNGSKVIKGSSDSASVFVHIAGVVIT